MTTGLLLIPPDFIIEPFGSASRATIPLNNADQAARLVWFTESRPRAALSLNAVVNNSGMLQSLVGCVIRRSYVQFVAGRVTVTGRLRIFVSIWPKLVMAWRFPVHFAQFVISIELDFRYIVCQGVPR